MATTPNYGWVTPAPTDFVTDLPADFETFADAVDGDLAGLLGGTTGQVLTKDSNADHDFSWATSAAGIPLTTIDAKGDLVAGTADDTVSRLAIGANNTVLTADSAEATGMKWATPPAPSYTWTTFTPVIKQGTTTFTVGTNTGRYLIIDKICHVIFRSDIVSGTGQANTEIQLYVPAAAQIANFGTPMFTGTIALMDSSNSYALYSGFFSAYQPDYGFLVSGINKATEEWGKTGSDFAGQLASNDLIYGTISYRLT